MRCDSTVLVIAPGARAEQEHRDQSDPSTDRMNDDRAREVVELCTEHRLEPVIEAECTVPGDSFKEGVDETDQHEGGNQLRIEARTLGDAARDDGGYRSREGQQKKELRQVVAALGGKRLGAGKEMDAVGNTISDEKVGDRGHGKVHKDLHQGIDLIFLAHGPQFEERETGMHRQDHHCPQQDEQDVAALF